MLADAAAATLCTVAPLLLVLADATATTFFTVAPPLLVLADGTAATLFTLAPLPLMLADAAAATFYAIAPDPLMLADAAASTVLTPAPTLLVLTQVQGLAGLLGTCRMQLRSHSLASCSGCVGSTLLFLVALVTRPLDVLALVWPSLLAEGS